jgi:hypothetical protein
LSSLNLSLQNPLKIELCNGTAAERALRLTENARDAAEQLIRGFCQPSRHGSGWARLS